MKAQMTTDNGVEIVNLTAIQMAPLGEAMFTAAKAFVATVQTDATGNFALDISSAGFSSAPWASPMALAPVGNVPITNQLLNQLPHAAVTFTSTSIVRGYVKSDRNAVIANLPVQLMSTPITVILFIAGT